MMSYAQEMKSMNCISTIGRIPMCAAPAAAPVKPISLMGVSTTRAPPKWSRNPSVILNAPPYAPMSSPITKTRSSRSISSHIPSRIASRRVTGSPCSVSRTCSGFSITVAMVFGWSGSGGVGRRVPRPRRVHRAVPVHVGQRFLGRGHGALFRLGHRLVQLAVDVGADGRQLVGRGPAVVQQRLYVAVDGVVGGRPVLDF